MQIFLLLSTLTFTSAAPIPKRALLRRVDALGAGDVVTCGNGAKLDTHDCDVAFLALGPGGLAGSIEFLRPNAAETTGTSGTCTFTATAIGGTIIDASKGRLEQGQEPMIAQCGAVVGSSVVVVGGTNNGGNVRLTISAAA